MSDPNWGLLVKSQVDNETIEQAIARLILAHEVDEESHLGVGESLQSHKASEIIDHLAESIVTDKIKNFEITDDKLAFDRLTIETDFGDIAQNTEYFEGTGSLVNFTGLLALSTGATINSIASLRNETYSEGYGADMTENPIFFAIAKVSSVADIDAYFGLEPADVGYFRFLISGGDLICESGWIGSVDSTNLGSGYDLTVFHKFRIVYDSGVSVKFYIDDVLVATHSTYLPEDSPTGIENLQWWRCEIENGVASDKKLFIRYINYCQDI